MKINDTPTQAARKFLNKPDYKSGRMAIQVDDLASLMSHRETKLLSTIRDLIFTVEGMEFLACGVLLRDWINKRLKEVSCQ